MLYEPDLLTVGFDVYNVEAEALGCAGSASPRRTTSRRSRRARFAAGDDIRRAAASPIPQRAGRMPVFLEAGRRIQARHRGGDDRPRRAQRPVLHGLRARRRGAPADGPPGRPGLGIGLASRFLHGRRGQGLRPGVRRPRHWASSCSIPTPRRPSSRRRFTGEIVLPGDGRGHRLFPRRSGRSPRPVYHRRRYRLPSRRDSRDGDEQHSLRFPGRSAGRSSTGSGTGVLLRANLDPRLLLTAAPAAITAGRARSWRSAAAIPASFSGRESCPTTCRPEKVLAVRRRWTSLRLPAANAGISRLPPACDKSRLPASLLLCGKNSHARTRLDPDPPGSRPPRIPPPPGFPAARPRMTTAPATGGACGRSSSEAGLNAFLDYEIIETPPDPGHAAPGLQGLGPAGPPRVQIAARRPRGRRPRSAADPRHRRPQRLRHPPRPGGLAPLPQGPDAEPAVLPGPRARSSTISTIPARPAERALQGAFPRSQEPDPRGKDAVRGDGGFVARSIPGRS